ncbi:MAG: tRNA pseudouridine(38-40) synthase TruA [Chloroflexi bacterium]|nr:tRNA pseudouridine(38-40) synthase TruA [Chloroflexota bacterium]
MRYRGTLAYDGTAYQGFQRQADGVPTIQAEVERAAAMVVGQPVTVLGAGRTDSGVHASGQVIAFDAEWRHGAERLLKAINANLPEDIALIQLATAPAQDFHPRFDAVSREYRYLVVNTPVRDPLLVRRAWHAPWTLDGDRMQAAAVVLIGTHDFGGFGRPPQGENTTRTVLRSEWTQKPYSDGQLWTYTIEANAFLHHMVRRIVGTLMMVGRGLQPIEWVERLLRDGRMPVGLAVAPPQGLTLMTVRY